MNEKGTLASRTPIVSVAVSRTRFSVSMRSAAGEAASAGGAAVADVRLVLGVQRRGRASSSGAGRQRQAVEPQRCPYGTAASKTGASGVAGGDCRPRRASAADLLRGWLPVAPPSLLQLGLRQLDVEPLHRVGRLAPPRPFRTAASRRRSGSLPNSRIRPFAYSIWTIGDSGKELHRLLEVPRAPNPSSRRTSALRRCPPTLSITSAW